MSHRQKVTEVDVTPTGIDAAYAAGFFDGEGSVSLNNSAVLQVSVAQNDERPLQWLLLRWGGSLVYGNGASGESINWRLSKANDVKRFLNDIYPYLKVKSETVTVVLAAIDLAPVGRRSVWQNYKKGVYADDQSNG